MQFILNQEELTVENFAPDTTLLEYLRTQLMHRGSKEGCASGDCGACTLVVADPSPNGLTYRTVNSCITYLGSLEGRQVITVEGLSSSTGELHPVQQAMVDHHASQCGFCTPGFVMSLFSLYKQREQLTQQERLTREEINEHLGGNLCRCTGYRPIIDAALSLSTQPDAFTEQTQSIREALLTLQASAQTNVPQPSLTPSSAFFHSPTQLSELIEWLEAHPDARLVAGGTDLALDTTQQLKDIPKLIYTGKVAELKRIEVTDDSLILGAAVTYQECHAQMKTHFPPLAALFVRLGSQQIRNQGTLGGNIANASPIGDTPPVLLALDAELRLVSPQGQQTLPIKDFFTGYRQTCLPKAGILESIRIPLLDPADFFRVYKISKRLDDDISAVCFALRIRLDAKGCISDARLGFGGMAATPARALHAEQALLGQAFTLEGIQAAQHALTQDFSPLTDVRASAQYRLEVAANLLTRAVHEYLTGTSLEVSHYA